MKTSDQIKKAILSVIKRYQTEEVRGLLTPSGVLGPYCLNWPNPWQYMKGLRCPGVYFFANPEDGIRYIGKTTATFESRFKDHFKMDEEGFLVEKKSMKGYISTTLYLLPVESTQLFHISSLEDYLIAAFKPTNNQRRLKF